LTWDQLKRVAEDLQEDAASGVEQGFCLQAGDPYHTYPILTGFGGYIFGRDPETDADNPQDLGLDSGGGIAYAKELDQMVKDGLIRADMDYGACLAMMTEERAALWISGPRDLADFEASAVNFGVAPIPTMVGTAVPFVRVHGMMVSANSPNMMLARTFLTEWMATDEAMQALFDSGHRPPAWLPTAEGVTDDNVRAFIQSAATANPMPAIPQMAEVWDPWTTAINLIFTQVMQPERAIREAAETIREAIGD
jgi:maltose-binding protein MalE